MAARESVVGTDSRAATLSRSPEKKKKKKKENA